MVAQAAEITGPSEAGFFTCSGCVQAASSMADRTKTSDFIDEKGILDVKETFPSTKISIFSFGCSRRGKENGRKICYATSFEQIGKILNAQTSGRTFLQLNDTYPKVCLRQSSYFCAVKI